jgi:hypothetical protein
MKKLLMFVFGVCFASYVFAAKDAVYPIPTGNWIIGPYSIFSTTTMLVGKFVGRNVACSVGVNSSANGQPINIQIWTSNYKTETGDTPNGTYQVAASLPLMFYKYNVNPITKNLYSYIRFYNINENEEDVFVINCSYF